MHFIFQISAYNQEELEEQLTLALDKRTELTSRRLLPRLWKMIDWLNRRKKSSKKSPHRNALRLKIYGVILLAMGIFLLIPGLMSPRALILPLLTGALATFLGINYLFSPQPMRKKTNKKFQKSAIKILDNLKLLSAYSEDPLEVHFTEKGMNMGPDTITYNLFDIVVETELLYLIALKTKIFALQKKDLVVGTPTAFIDFLNMQIPLKSESVL